MPMRIEHIDAIARKLQRGVLFVEFHAPNQRSGNHTSRALKWEMLPIRQQVIDWLNARKIQWERCGHYASTSYMAAYRGQIYVDVPFDKRNRQFVDLSAFLENPDGSMRFPDCTLYYCPLYQAMENAEHDTPGFWDRWADTF